MDSSQDGWEGGNDREESERERQKDGGGARGGGPGGEGTWGGGSKGEGERKEQKEMERVQTSFFREHSSCCESRGRPSESNCGTRLQFFTAISPPSPRKRIASQ